MRIYSSDTGDTRHQRLDDVSQLGEVGQTKVVHADRFRDDASYRGSVHGRRYPDADKPYPAPLHAVCLGHETGRFVSPTWHSVGNEHEQVVRGRPVRQRRPDGGAGQPQRTCRVRVAARVPDAAKRDDQLHGLGIAVEVELHLGLRAVADCRVPDARVGGRKAHHFGYRVRHARPVRYCFFVVVADAARMIEDEQHVDEGWRALGVGRRDSQSDDEDDRPQRPRQRGRAPHLDGRAIRVAATSQLAGCFSRKC